MNIMMNIIINIYSFILLLIIFNHSTKHYDKDFLNDVLFRYMMMVTGFMLIVDILSRFDGNALAIYPYMNQVGNFLIFLLAPVLPSLWVAYVYFQIYQDKARVKRLIYPLGAFNLINLGFLMVSQFTGGYYVIDEFNVYQRGPLYGVSIFMTMLFLLSPL